MRLSIWVFGGLSTLYNSPSNYKSLSSSFPPVYLKNKCPSKTIHLIPSPPPNPLPRYFTAYLPEPSSTRPNSKPTIPRPNDPYPSQRRSILKNPDPFQSSPKHQNHISLISPSSKPQKIARVIKSPRGKKKRIAKKGKKSEPREREKEKDKKKKTEKSSRVPEKGYLYLLYIYIYIYIHTGPGKNQKKKNQKKKPKKKPI